MRSRLLVLACAVLGSAQIPFPGPGRAPVSGGGGLPLHVQGTASASFTSTTTPSTTLGSDPASGNIVICAVIQYATNTTLNTVTDGNSNAYTISPSSPSPIQTTGGAGRVWIAYLLSAPGNAEKNITATFASANGAVGVLCDEFTPGSLTKTFDTDYSGIDNNWSTATITPAGAGELLYAATAVQSAVTSPGAGATQGIWTGAGGGIVGGDGAEYILSAGSGAITADFAPGQAQATVIVAIK